MRSCPRCSELLKQNKFDGRRVNKRTGQPLEVTMDECPLGCGFWFDAHELENTLGLEEHLEEHARPTDCISNATCPSCGGHLALIDVERVELDRCVGCAGLWLDAGELKKLEETLRAAGVVLGATAQKITCSSCGKDGLASHEVFLGERGLRCRSCLKHEEAQHPEEEEHEHFFGNGLNLIVMAETILRGLGRS